MTRRGGRVAEGAALEMPCTGNCTVGSNPTPSAIFLTVRCSKVLPVVEKGSADGPLSATGPLDRARRGGSGAL